MRMSLETLTCKDNRNGHIQPKLIEVNIAVKCVNSSGKNMLTLVQQFRIITKQLRWNAKDNFATQRKST